MFFRFQSLEGIFEEFVKILGILVCFLENEIEKIWGRLQIILVDFDVRGILLIF